MFIPLTHIHTHPTYHSHTHITHIYKYINIYSFIDLALGTGQDTFIFHQHIAMMMERSLSKYDMKEFHALGSVPDILAWLERMDIID